MLVAGVPGSDSHAVSELSTLTIEEESSPRLNFFKWFIGIQEKISSLEIHRRTVPKAPVPILLWNT